MSLKFTRIRK